MLPCFHCGLPLPAVGALRLAILGTERELCCPGCEAVARTIVESGLGQYYATRTAERMPLPVLAPAPDYRGYESDHASLVLQGVRCSACLWLIERALARLPGVSGVAVNYATQRAQVGWDRTQIDLGRIVEAIRAVGYDAWPYEPAAAAALERRERRSALWRLFVAGFGAMQVMMYAFPAYIDAGELSAEAAAIMRWASLLITAPVLVFSCAPFFAGALRELRARRIGLDVPIALGLAGGFLASAWATVGGSGEVYFDSMSMLAFLLLGARFVESGARRRATRALDPLLRWMPARAMAVGETATVAPGDAVPADGVVLSGVSSADESLLTGESRAVAKRTGDQLIAGSVNLEQPLVMRATRVGAQTRAAAIARLVERGAAAKPPVVQSAERMGGALTIVILVLGLSTWLVSKDFWSAIAVLVVACPCALALAAPAVLTRASGEFLKRGMLLANAAALQPLARVTDIVLDKTGTLTTGRLAVTALRVTGDVDEKTCREWASALESGSRHPIARAFAATEARAADVRHVVGHGIEGSIDGRRLRIGSARFCGLADERPGRVFLADERACLAMFMLHDELRPDAERVIATLKQRYRLHLASGDSEAAASEIGRRLGISLVRGGLTPEEKLDYVARLQAAGRVVVMVGDGLNDAPVLARADASFAIAGGAEAAQLHADVILQGRSLMRIADALQIACRSMRLVHQNLAWALAYNALALPLAAFGWIGPLQAALAMGASSLSVLLNALRPLRLTQVKGPASAPAGMAAWRQNVPSP